MKKKLISLFLIVILAISIVPLTSVADANATPDLTFTTTTLKGKTIRSSIIKDYDLVVLNIWAEWCGPCVGELPALAKIYKNYPNVLIIGAWVGSSETNALATAKEAGVTYPLVHLADSIEDYAYRSQYIPATYFFNSEGKEIGNEIIGSMSYEGWQATVEELLPEITKPAITTQPKNKSVAIGKTASFTVKATGGSLRYQWYYKAKDSTTWKAVSAASGKTATYSLKTEARHNGYQYKCVVKNVRGKVTSNIVTLKVGAAPSITKQPANKSVAVGNTTTFKVTASGSGLTYQWYFRTSSDASWKAVSADSGKTAAYKLTVAKYHNGYQYRCKVKNAFGYVYTGTVTLKAYSYVLNKNTMKFHLPGCKYVPEIAAEHKVLSAASRQTLLNKGYTACKVCKP